MCSLFSITPEELRRMARAEYDPERGYLVPLVWSPCAEVCYISQSERTAGKVVMVCNWFNPDRGELSFVTRTTVCEREDGSYCYLANKVL